MSAELIASDVDDLNVQIEALDAAYGVLLNLLEGVKVADDEMLLAAFILVRDTHKNLREIQQALKARIEASKAA